jgi:co-chaperonin GroES (HSP10)
MEGIAMKPLNRRLLIEVTKEETQQGAFFVPTEEEPQEFLTAKVIACADNCSTDLTGKMVVFHAFGREEVKVKGKNYTFIGENHLICAD